jgi:hypothetical protein
MLLVAGYRRLRLLSSGRGSVVHQLWPRVGCVSVALAIIALVSACRIGSLFPLFSQSAFVEVDILPAKLTLSNGSLFATVTVAAEYPGVPVYRYIEAPRRLDESDKKKMRDYVYTCSQKIAGQECPELEKYQMALQVGAQPGQDFLLGVIPIARDVYAVQVVRVIAAHSNNDYAVRENDIALVRILNKRELVWLDDIEKCAANERPSRFGMRFQRQLDLQVKLIESTSDERSIAFFRDCIATEKLGEEQKLVLVR